MTKYMRVMLMAVFLLIVSGRVMAAGFTIDEGDGVNVSEDGTTDTYIVQVDVTDPPTAAAIYTATTDDQCTVTTPDGGSTQTIAAGSTVPFSVTVTAVDDAVDEISPHDCFITHLITSVGDPEYDGLGQSPTRVNVTDDDTADIVFPTSPITVVEGSVPNSYEVSAATPAQGTIVIELSTDGQCNIVSANPQTIPGNSTAPVTITVAANDDLVDEADTHNCVISHSLSESLDPIYAGLGVLTYTVNVTDNDVAGITISPDAVTVTEPNGTGTYTITLDTEPTDSVNIDLTATGDCTIISSDPIELDAATLTANVTVEAINDQIVNGSRTCTISHTVTSPDGNYDGVAVTDKEITVEDEDVPGFSFDPLGISVNEEGATTNYYDIRLTTLPLAGVTITAVVTDTTPQCAITSVTGAPIVDNLNDFIRVNVQAIDDTDIESPNHFCTISHTVTSSDAVYNGLSIDDYSVIVTDNEIPSVNISTASGDLLEAGTPIQTYTISLSQATTQPVTITATTNAECEIVTQPAQIPISGIGPVTVEVRAINDNLVDALPHTCVITHTVTSTGNYNGVTAADQTIPVIDNDATALQISDATVTEGDASPVTMTFTVTLTNPSETTVTVNYTTVDGTAISPADFTAATGTLTFNPLDTTETIDVSIIGDTTDEINETFTVTLSGASGATIADDTGIGTITDNDDPAIPPNATIADVTQAEGSSGSTTFTFTISLDAPAVGGETITYSTANGTAIEPGDYTAVTATTPPFTAGAQTQTINVTIVGDTDPEANETFFVNLTAASGLVITDNQAVGTINNDDVTVSIDNVSGNETDSSTTPFVFTVTVTGALTAPLTVDFATVNNSAAAPGDFSAITVPASPLTFNTSGSTSHSQTITVNVIGDTTPEADEQFFVNFTTTGATVTNGSGSGTIINDDIIVGVPNASINDPAALVESGGVITFTITLSAPAVGGETITYATADGSATAGSDYTAVSATTPPFTAGATTHTFNVAVIGDTIDEADEETFVVNLTAATGLNITDGQGTGIIQDDDLPPVLPNATIADVSIAEGDAGTVNLAFTITLSAPAVGGETITYSTADGSATAGSDYTAVSTTHPFTAGATTHTFNVAVIGDLVDETNETFFVNLTAATGLTIGDTQAVGTITDDDDPAVVPNVTIADNSVIEGNAGTVNLAFTIALDAPAVGGETITYATADNSATAGSDYTAVSNTHTFTAGATTHIVNVAVIGDTLDEVDETLVLNLSAPSGLVISVSQATGTIVDDDAPPVAPSVSINSPASLTEGSGGTSPLNFTVTVTGTISTPLSVNFVAVADTATTPEDFVVITPSPLVFPADALTTTRSQTITVNVFGDLLVEGNHQFFIDITVPGVTVSQSRGIGTIVDDDTPSGQSRLSIGSASVSEGNSGTRNMAFRVTVSPTSPSAITVTYATLTNGTAGSTDFTAVSGQVLNIPANTAQATINISIIGDTLVESNETFSVRLSNAVGAIIGTATGTGTINDDDGTATATPQPTTTPTPQPTATPIPTMSLCADMNGTTNPIIRAQVPPGTVTNGNVYCRVLAENGEFIYVGGSGSIGNEQVLRLGVIHAVDVFGLLAGGIATRDFNNGVLVCLQGAGSLVYLDARGAPRPPVRLTNTTSESGYTCGTIPSAGTVVLVGQAGDLPGVSTGVGGGSRGPAFALSDCVVTTMMRLNLRVWGGLDGRILGIVPEGVDLPAFERTRRWYRVQYGSIDGWISAFYVRPQGACGD